MIPVEDFAGLLVDQEDSYPMTPAKRLLIRITQNLACLNDRIGSAKLLHLGFLCNWDKFFNKLKHMICSWSDTLTRLQMGAFHCSQQQ